LDYSVKAIQAQQLYKVPPVVFDEKSNNRNISQRQEYTGINPFKQNVYTPNHPSVENSPTLGKNLDLLS